MNKHCGQCGVDFKLSRPAKAKDVNYCSHDCYWESKRKRVVVACADCGQRLERNTSTAKEHNFCDLECRNEYWKKEKHFNSVDYPTKCCLICSKEIPRHIAKRRYAKYCGLECKRLGKTGELNVGWKGGEGNLPYPSIFGRRLKLEIRKRDGFKCQSCGKTEAQHKTEVKRALSVHHIDSDKNNCKPSNLITTCQKCNVAAKNNQEYWVDFYHDRLKSQNTVKIQGVPDRR